MASPLRSDEYICCLRQLPILLHELTAAPSRWLVLNAF